MTHVRIAEDHAVVTCPHCGGDVPLTYDATDWYIRSANDVNARLGAIMGALEREELRVLLLNAKNRVMQAQTVYVGNVSASLVRVAEVVRPAVEANASGMILVHNHPSGDPTPSPDDLHLTAEVLAAGRLLDIDVLDHVIIGRDGWTSLRDRGVAFDRRTPAPQA